jgi:membrane protease YdiL (CAAX protease family)
LTFSYTAVAALVPASLPGVLLVRTAVWTVVVVAAHAGWARRGGRPATAAWAFPLAWGWLLLAVVAVVAVVLAVVLPPAGRSHADLVRITVIGVVGEEVLFRGLLWDVAQRVGQRVGRWPDPATLTLTTVLFALSHLQYNGFRLTLGLAGQVGYALVAGVVLGWARGQTGSVLPSILLHATGNAGLKLAALLR